MSKQILNLANGAVVLSEDAGVFTLTISEQAEVGGGEAKGLLKAQGSGSVVLDAMGGLKLGEALLNAHLPMQAQPLAQVVEGIVNQAVSVLE